MAPATTEKERKAKQAAATKLRKENREQKLGQTKEELRDRISKRDALNKASEKEVEKREKAISKLEDPLEQRRARARSLAATEARNAESAEREHKRQLAQKKLVDKLPGESQTSDYVKPKRREAVAKREGAQASADRRQLKGGPRPSNKMMSAEQYADMTVDALKALAKEKGVTVVRTDGSSGKPRHADYVAALSS